MEQYISKAAVLAKIRKYINNAETYLKYHHNRNDKSVYAFEQEKLAMCELLSSLNNLEVKEEPVSEDKMTISKEWFEHCKKSWYNEGYIDGEYNRDRQFEEPVSEDFGEYINELSKQFPEVSFAKVCKIATRTAKWLLDVKLSKLEED
jgi:hypothetical protein